MSLCWQQITFCSVALVLVLANVGTAQKRREKPSTTVSSVCRGSPCAFLCCPSSLASSS